MPHFAGFCLYLMITSLVSSSSHENMMFQRNKTFFVFASAAACLNATFY
jgi:hypothetical protein